MENIIYPKNAVNSTVNADYIDMADIDQVTITYFFGELDCQADVLVLETTDTDGGEAQAIEKFSVTQMSGNDHVEVIVKKEDVSPGYRYIRGQVVFGAGSSGYVCVVANYNKNPALRNEKSKTIFLSGSESPSVLER